jgi:hypothetical protein
MFCKRANLQSQQARQNNVNAKNTRKILLTSQRQRQQQLLLLLLASLPPPAPTVNYGHQK